MDRKRSSSKLYKNLAITAGIVIVLCIGIFAVKQGLGNGKSISALQGDLIIPKSEITENAQFYPVNLDGRNMEIIAVRAGDGTIRTAFNTCQVCNGSPKAYYKQEGDMLVCQNCGNKFSMDMVEEQRGGCNPVPIYKENKRDDGSGIVISKEFIEQNKSLFTSNWKTK